MEVAGPELARIATELQCLGLRVNLDLAPRRGGAGPAEGGSLMLGGRPLSVPTASPFVAASPYELRARGEEAVLFRHGHELMPVELVPRPSFLSRRTQAGLPYRQLALLHGADCLATTVLQTCAHWAPDRRCRFCGIELPLAHGGTVARKDPAALAEVAAWAAAQDGVTHAVLTTGSAGRSGAEIGHLAACARAVKTASGLAIHAQFMPPGQLADMEQLKLAGVDTVGIHLESFDRKVLALQAPAKAALGLERFLAAWQRAVEIFGPGQVESFLLAGLGESRESLLQGAGLLADLGVFPFLLPLRPIPGSLMAEASPPPPEYMAGLYQDLAPILAARGLNSSACLAGCVRCGACSALGYYEEEPRDLICHPARTREERARALDIRQRVFVDEQGLFEGSDLDEADERAVHLVARYKGGIVGTVRTFPVGRQERAREGHWIGGRLAVLKTARASGAAQLLVREAVRTAKGHDCQLFTAHIQEPNVLFFRRLGWRVEGEPFTYRGKPHRLMIADLDKA